MMKVVRRLFALATLVLATSVRGEEGHDHSHFVSEDLGTVSFASTCAPEVRSDFERAVALLHSFGYEVARDGFRAVARRDPDCGIAWWGVAMTYYHPIWAPPNPEELSAGRQAAEKAAAIGAKSEREKAFMEAIGAFYRDDRDRDHKRSAQAYREKMEDVTRRFPDDSEARIFLALALLGTAPPHDTSYAQQRRAAEILTPLSESHPKHPGIPHYVIHSFDYPGLAELALPAARVYAKVAPASPHAQHMPSHIFTRLGLWRESIASNLDSEASASAIIAKNHPGAASFDALHALDYLVYAYLQIGEDGKAKEALDRVLAAKRFDEPNFAAGYAVAASPARWLLERRAWAEAARLAAPTAELQWERFPYAIANLHFARALGGARSGDLETAGKALRELESIRDRLAAAPADGPYDWAGQVESLRLAAAGWMAKAEGRSEEALSLLRKAADLQDKVGKNPVTPGEVLPARELLADLLLDSGHPKEALAEYEAGLAAAPNRLNGLYAAARAAKVADDAVKAKEFRERLVAQCAPDTPRAEVVKLLARSE